MRHSLSICPYLYKKIGSIWSTFPSIDHLLPGPRSISVYSVGPKVSPFLREKCVLVPGSRWRVDNWPIVCAAAMNRGVCIRRFVGRGTTSSGGRRREQRKSVSTRISRSSRESGPRGPGAWSMNGTRPQRWPTVPIGRVQYHSGTRFDQSLVGFSSLVPSLFPACPFFLLSSPRTAPYLDTAPPLPLLLQFLPFRSLVLLVAEDSLARVACVLLGIYLSSIMRRRLSSDCCEQIGRVLLSLWFLLLD